LFGAFFTCFSGKVLLIKKSPGLRRALSGMGVFLDRLISRNTKGRVIRTLPFVWKRTGG